MCCRHRTLAPESFKNQVFHAVELVFGVRVLADVAEFIHIRRVNLLVLTVNNKITLEVKKRSRLKCQLFQVIITFTRKSEANPKKI